MTLKSMAQMKAMSSMGSKEAEQLRITSSPTLTSESSGGTVMLVASRETNHKYNSEREHSRYCCFSDTDNRKNVTKNTLDLTCDGEIARAVGLSSVILGKAGVNALIIFCGIEDLQTPIIQDSNATGEQN